MKFHIKRLALFFVVLLLVFSLYFFAEKPHIINIPDAVIVGQRGNSLPINVRINLNPVNSQDMFLLWSSESLKHVQKSPILKCNGFSNKYVWNDICGARIQNLLYHPLFPNLPTYRGLVDSIHIKNVAHRSGVRVFGYLRIFKPGYTQFKVTSMNVNSRFYLSYSFTNSSFLVKDVTSLMRTSVVSKWYLLKSKSYYFDVVLKTSDMTGWYKLEWRVKGETDFSVISDKFIRCQYDDVNVTQRAVALERPAITGLPMLKDNAQLSELYETAEDVKRSRMYKLPFISEKDVKGLFVTCAYSPSYIVKHVLSQYEGVFEMHYTSLYPEEKITAFYRLKTNENQTIFGNDVLNKSTALNVVDEVMNALVRKHGK